MRDSQRVTVPRVRTPATIMRDSQRVMVPRVRTPATIMRDSQRVMVPQMRTPALQLLGRFAGYAKLSTNRFVVGSNGLAS